MAWEIKRTVRVKLEVPDQYKSDFHATNDQFQYCANKTAEWAWRKPDENCVTDRFEAESALYDQLREETDYLHSTLVQQAIKRAIGDVNNGVSLLAEGKRTSCPEYETFSIPYPRGAATYSRYKVSLATVNGRVECRYNLPEDPEGTPHGEYLFNTEYEIATSTLHYDSATDEFHLHTVMKRELDVDSPEKAEDSNVLGVDSNVEGHTAVTSTGAFIGNADQLNHYRRVFTRRRANLRETGTRSSHQTLEQIRNGFGKWSEDYLHHASKEIVEEARRHDCTHIAFENLREIRDTISDEQRFQTWAFAELRRQVEYKAERYGIVVEAVEPKNTSLRCSKCGCIHYDNRDGKRFNCVTCGYQQHVDYNAAKNVGRKLALQLQEGQKSPAGGAYSQYALKSGTVTVNRRYALPDQAPSAEQRSSDKPPTE